MGVAKGLFYHYFDSKEDLLSAIMDRLVDEIQASVAAALERDGLTALERLAALAPSHVDIDDRSKLLVKLFHEQRNQAFHHVMRERSLEFLTKATETLIVQGNEEGVFHVKWPAETARVISSLVPLIIKPDREPSCREEVVRKAEVMQDLMERLLGSEAGALDAIFANILRSKLECHPDQGDSR